MPNSLVKNFRKYWDACAEVSNPAAARKELVSRIVQSVYVQERKVVAVVLYRDYALVLGENETAHANIASAVQKWLVERGINGYSACNRNGHHGCRSGASSG